MLLGQDRGAVADAQEIAAVVDSRDRVELPDGLRNDAAGLQNAGVGHYEVQPAEPPDDGLEQGRHRGVVGDVDRQPNRPPNAKAGRQGGRLALGLGGV